MFSFRGLIAVIITAGVLSVPLYYYWEFLTKGTRPSPATLKLDELEKSGMPDFSVTDLNGKSVSLYEFKGRPVVLNIWATWCAPCVKEFPSLKRLVEHFDGKLVVVAVSYDNSMEDLQSFIQAFGSVPKDFVILWDKERISGKILGTDQLPETYILSPELKVVRKIAGEQAWDNPNAFKFFAETFGL